jgi:AcrR family transcriptional regulator
VSANRERRSQSERKAATRDALERATVAVVAAVGFEGLTIDSVATASGLSRGATCFHFAHREELVDPVIALTIGALAGDCQRAFGTSAGVGAAKIRSALGALLHARHRDEPAVRAWPEVLRRAARHQPTAERLLPRLRQLEHDLGALVAQASREAGLTLRFEPAQIGALLLALCESTLERKSLESLPLTDDDVRAFGTIGIAMTMS